MNSKKKEKLICTQVNCNMLDYEELPILNICESNSPAGSVDLGCFSTTCSLK